MHVIENGVNTDYFAPRAERPSPYAANEAPIVFTGAMDYWPNIDAVTWFASRSCRAYSPCVRTRASISSE